MLQKTDQNKILLEEILSMSHSELETYFLSLDKRQREYIQYLLRNKARPNPSCDLLDGKASFADWITSHFYVPELDGPIWLHEYQIEALKKATSKDKDGLYNYSLIAWMDIKKSIKSCIAGAVALRMAFMRDWASIKVIANKREQAASRSYFYITRSLELNPDTKRMIENGDISITNYTINFHFNKSTIKAIPLNPEGEAGGNDDLIIWTEAWAARTNAAQKMWTEMVIPPQKFGKGFKWIESYAGFSGDSPILEPIYLENVQDNYRIKNTDMYSNERTFCLCNHTPRLPWQTSEYYSQQRKELIEAEFDRVHRNIWQSSTSKFIDNTQWDLLKRNIPPLKKKEKIILALDVGLLNDCFAVVGVNKYRGKVAVRIVRVWTPKKGKKLHFSNPTNDKSLDKQYPYGFIKFLSENYRILELRYDPYQAEKMAEDFVRERIVNCKPFSQQGERLKADKHLLDLIRFGDIIHNGDVTLSEHIKNANMQIKGDNKLRLVKQSDAKKIDSAVALSMASYSVEEFRF